MPLVSSLEQVGESSDRKTRRAGEGGGLMPSGLLLLSGPCDHSRNVPPCGIKPGRILDKVQPQKVNMSVGIPMRGGWVQAKSNEVGHIFKLKIKDKV